MSNYEPRRPVSPATAASGARRLVIFPGALGDLVCFLPALAEIARFESFPPVLLCSENLASLVQVTGIAEPQPIEARSVSWLFSANPPAEAERTFAAFSAIDSFTGFGDPTVAANLERWVGARGRLHPFRPRETVHVARHFLECVGAAGSSSESRLSLPESTLDCGRKKFAAVLDQPPLLVLHPGSGGASKRWSRAGFVAVAKRWLRKRGTSLVALGPSETGERSYWQETGLSVTADLEILELASLLALADAYLGNDSGVSHLAAAVGASGAVLFGPSDPRIWRPLSPRLRVVRLEPWQGLDDSPAPLTIQMLDRQLRSAQAAKSP